MCFNILALMKTTILFKIAVIIFTVGQTSLQWLDANSPYRNESAEKHAVA